MEGCYKVSQEPSPVWTTPALSACLHRRGVPSLWPSSCPSPGLTPTGPCPSYAGGGPNEYFKVKIHMLISMWKRRVSQCRTQSTKGFYRPHQLGQANCSGCSRALQTGYLSQVSQGGSLLFSLISSALLTDEHVSWLCKKLLSRQSK